MGILAETGKGLLKGMAGPIAGAAIGGIQSIVQRNWQKKMWEKMNRYNSPQYQMSRYRAAGLNPNLIYQSGNAGNATQVQPYQKPNTDLTKSILETQQVSQSKQQTGLLKAQADTEEQRQNLMKAQAFAAIKQAGLSETQAFAIMEKLDPEIRQISTKSDLQAMQTGESKANIQLLKSSNAYNKAKIALTKMQITGQNLDNVFKQFKNEFWEEKKLNINDSWYIRIFSDMLDENNTEAANWINKMQKNQKKYPNIYNNLNK